MIFQKKLFKWTFLWAHTAPKLWILLMSGYLETLCTGVLQTKCLEPVKSVHTCRGKWYYESSQDFWVKFTNFLFLKNENLRLIEKITLYSILYVPKHYQYLIWKFFFTKLVSNKIFDKFHRFIMSSILLNHLRECIYNYNFLQKKIIKKIKI